MCLCLTLISIRIIIVIMRFNKEKKKAVMPRKVQMNRHSVHCNATVRLEDFPEVDITPDQRLIIANFIHKEVVDGAPTKPRLMNEMDRSALFIH